MNLTDPIFSDEAKAREWFEEIRWPNGPFCPHCGETAKVYRLNGQSHRAGLVHCNGCNEAFTVTVGTVMERSHVPLNKWALAFRLMTSSKKGISAHQLHRTIAVTYKTAWFMAHRIREAMKETDAAPLGGEGKTVEADEVYIGRNAKPRTNKRGGEHKNKVVSLVERGGKVRSIHVDRVTSSSAKELLTKHADAKSKLMTDEATWYIRAGKEFASHESVAHRAEEWVRGNVHTNTIEGFFSIFKRGMTGVYQHCGEQHLHRYLAEFDFRYSNRIALGVDDVLRTLRAVKGAEGKRLTYQRPRGAQQTEA
jgi:transposase-like protein